MPFNQFRAVVISRKAIKYLCNYSGYFPLFVRIYNPPYRYNPFAKIGYFERPNIFNNC